jgi:hypothetical protein
MDLGIDGRRALVCATSQASCPVGQNILLDGSAYPGTY